jgi:hypothetical protein
MSEDYETTSVHICSFEVEKYSQLTLGSQFLTWRDFDI